MFHAALFPFDSMKREKDPSKHSFARSLSFKASASRREGNLYIVLSVTEGIWGVSSFPKSSSRGYRIEERLLVRYCLTSGKQVQGSKC